MLEQRRGGSWGVARHSAPAWINVGGVERRWLPATATAGKGEGGKKQDVQAFVKEVRRRVGYWGRRRRAAEGFVKAAGQARERMEDGDAAVRVRKVEVDKEVSLVGISWEDGREAKARVDERGRVGRVVVMDKKGERDGDLERRMRGTLEGLGERLGWS